MNKTILFSALFGLLGLVRPSFGQKAQLLAGVNEKKAGMEAVSHEAAFPQLTQYLNEHLHYPEQAKQNGVDGIVVVETAIGKTGEVLSVGVVNGIGFGCDEAVMELVSNMPPWIPAIKNGEQVAQNVFIRVRFRLK